MTDHPMTHYIPIGDVELPLPLIARALGIPAATLDKLASGEWVAVPREPTEDEWKRIAVACDADPESLWLCRARYLWKDAVPAAAMLAAATEDASHDD